MPFCLRFATVQKLLDLELGNKLFTLLANIKTKSSFTDFKLDGQYPPQKIFISFSCNRMLQEKKR